MARRRGANRGTGSRKTTFLDALIDGVVREIRAPRNEARQESRLPRREPSIGAVRLGLRREGEAYTDFSGDRFRGDLTNADAADALSDVIARRMRALGIEPSTDVQTVDVNAEAGSFARRLSFELRIPGTHYSGNTNQRLLEFRQAEGRDFAADTSELREHVRKAVAAEMGTTWDDDRAAQIASREIVVWIVKRIYGEVTDVELEPLSPTYRAWKASHGLDTRIGIAHEKWVKAVARAEAIVTA